MKYYTDHLIDSIFFLIFFICNLINSTFKNFKQLELTCRGQTSTRASSYALKYI